MSKDLATAEMLERFLLLANVFHKEYGIRNDEDVVEVEKGKHISKYDYKVYLEIQKALKDAEKYKKAVEILKGNISLEFIHPFKSVRYEVWLNRGDEEPILIANTQEEYELLQEILL